jgi:hypothetical protein
LQNFFSLSARCATELNDIVKAKSELKPLWDLMIATAKRSSG